MICDHVISTANLNTAPPIVEEVSASEEETFTTNELLSSAFIIDEATFNQGHELENDRLLTGRPILPEITFVQGHEYNANNILSGAPTIPTLVYNAALGRIAEEGLESISLAELVVSDPNTGTLTVQKPNSVEIAA